MGGGPDAAPEGDLGPDTTTDTTTEPTDDTESGDDDEVRFMWSA